MSSLLDRTLHFRSRSCVHRGRAIVQLIPRDSVARQLFVIKGLPPRSSARARALTTALCTVAGVLLSWRVVIRVKLSLPRVIRL